MTFEELLKSQGKGTVNSQGLGNVSNFKLPDTIITPEVKPVTSLMDGFDYSKGLAIGGDGKVYDNGLNNTFTDIMAEKGVELPAQGSKPRKGESLLGKPAAEQHPQIIHIGL